MSSSRSASPRPSASSRSSGRVNPLALEEFAALEQRHKFLTEQLTDLTNTRRDLLTIIEEIDEKMQSIFQSAFEDTKAAFGDVFPVLFPGGSGSIQLTDPDEHAHDRHRGVGEARRARRSSGSRCCRAVSDRSPRSPC